MNALTTLARCCLWLGLGCALVVLPAAFAQAPNTKPVKVTIEEDKNEISDRHLPLDPAIRVEWQYVGNMMFGVTSQGKLLTCGPGANTAFKIDGQLVYPDAGAAAQQLPAGPNGKKRTGMQVVWGRGDLKVTMILEAVPGKPFAKDGAASQKRRMDTLLIKYIIENNGTKPHQVGVRTYIDTQCGVNDACIFASPTTQPGKLLDGVVLKDKEVPEFLQMLEVPNLQNPGFTGIFTFKMGKKIEAPNKVVLTRNGAISPDGWDVPGQPAMTDSAAVMFWDPQAIKPKGQREVAFALGQGIACNPENEGKVTVSFGGNFEPSKEFTVTAYVDDPIEGQSLALELPKGMVRVQGKAMQAVPPPNGEGRSIVLWKGRVQDLGEYFVRIRSSNGVTYTRCITISRPK